MNKSTEKSLDYQQGIMKKELLHLLDYTSGLFKKNNIPFWLACGTLLGAVREGKLIPWDTDLDIGMWESDAQKLIDLELIILSDGFQVEHVAEDLPYVIGRYKEWGLLKDWNPDKHVQSHYYYRICFRSRHIDIRYTIINDSMAFCKGWPHNRCPSEDLQNLKEIEFEGKMYPCPRNPEEWLKTNYGEDWETPKIESYMIPRLSKDILKKYADKIFHNKLMPPYIDINEDENLNKKNERQEGKNG